MDTAFTGREGPRLRHAEICIAHDEDGKVWMLLYPAEESMMTLDGERVEAYDVPMSPELATELGRSLIDEVNKVMRLGQTGSH